MAFKHEDLDVWDCWDMDDDSPLDEEFRTCESLFAKKLGPDNFAEYWHTITNDYYHGKLKTLTQGPSEMLRSLVSRKEIIRERHELKNLQGLKDEHIFQAIFINQKNSNSRLLVTRDLFESICRLLNIFTNIKDFALSFGFKIRESDIGSPPCRFHIRKLASALNYGIYECAYGLRYVERNRSSDPSDLWRVRQVAIYQKFKGCENPQTWLFLSASRSMKKAVRTHMEKNITSNNWSPFELHVALIAVALVNWRWYIKSLVEQTEDQTSRIVAANVVDRRSASFIEGGVNFDDRQTLKVTEDRLCDMVIIFESVLDTIMVLLGKWEKVRKQGDDHAAPDTTAAHLEEFSREVRLYKEKVKVLHERVKGSSILLSNMLEYENAKQTQANGESLKALAEESRAENAAMKLLTEKATKDAAAVKVITLITIVYLPTTVVAGFFSTQFVSQEKLPDGLTRLKLTDNWWIYVAVSVPLTVCTILIWYAWVTYPWSEWWKVARKEAGLQRLKHLNKPPHHLATSMEIPASPGVALRSRFSHSLSEINTDRQQVMVWNRSSNVTLSKKCSEFEQGIGISHPQKPFGQHSLNELPQPDVYSCKNSLDV